MKNKTSAIIRLVIYILVASLLIGVLIIGINGGIEGFIFNTDGISFDKDKDLSGYTEAENGTAEIDSSNISQISVDWISGSVNVKIGTGDKITLSESASGDIPENNKMKYNVSGNTLSIDGGNVQFRFFNFGKDFNKILTVVIPQKIYNSLDIETTSAEISIDNTQFDSIKLNSVSGKITATDITSSSLDLESVSGDMTIAGTVTQSIESDCVSGNVCITDTVCPKNAQFDSVSGETELLIPSESGFSADISTISGSFNTDFSTTKNDDEYRSGDGSADFQFDSVSGDIIISSHSLPESNSSK